MYIIQILENNKFAASKDASYDIISWIDILYKSLNPQFMMCLPTCCLLFPGISFDAQEIICSPVCLQQHFMVKECSVLQVSFQSPKERRLGELETKLFASVNASVNLFVIYMHMSLMVDRISDFINGVEEVGGFRNSLHWGKNNDLKRKSNYKYVNARHSFITK